MLKVSAIGRLTTNVDVQEVGEGKYVTNFVLACRDGNGTEYITCTAWNEVAKTIQAHTKQGALLYIEGSLKTKEWVDNNTQIKHKRIFIKVETFEFLSRKDKVDTLALV